jgi:hypothetical protein
MEEGTVAYTDNGEYEETVEILSLLVKVVEGLDTSSVRGDAR